MRRFAFYFLMFALTTLVCACILYLAANTLGKRIEPALRSIAATALSEKNRAAIYDHLAAQSGFIWDTDPDPRVARLGKRHFVGRYGNAEVLFNNAGLRSANDFAPKEEGVFRIVCLGDSMVFGLAGAEEDRYCNQIERFYREHPPRKGGSRVETYAVGIGSWTLVQEATYLTSRLSSYEPDLILLLSVANDITDIHGVTGAGTMTGTFSPEHREWGSAFFSNQAGLHLGQEGYSALTTGLGPESRSRWSKAMASIDRLVKLQELRGGKTLCSLLVHPGYTERFESFYSAAGIRAPLLQMSYFRSDPAYRLPHDNHPNRRGHAVLAAHYLKALDALGWLDVEDDDLPDLDPRLSLEIVPRVDVAELAAIDQAFIDEHLRSELDFEDLAERDKLALLGGLRRDRSEENGALWASLRAGWLMKRPPGGSLLRLEISIPKRPELFPFELEVRLDGQSATWLRVADVSESGIHEIEVDLPEPTYHDDVVEVLLSTSSYFAEIVDPAMKSFRPIAARIVAGN